MRRLMTCLLMILPCTAGCSWAFMPHLAEDRDPNAFPECTSDLGAPYADVATAASGALTVIGALAGIVDGADNSIAVPSLLAGLGVAVVSGFSARSGFQWGQSCREATARWTVSASASAISTSTVGAGPPGPLGGHAWYCTASRSDASGSACARTLGECDAAARVLAASRPDVPGCEATPAVVCYRTLALDGTKAEHCLPTMSACLASHGQAAAHTDLYQRIGDCDSADSGDAPGSDTGR